MFNEIQKRRSIILNKTWSDRNKGKRSGIQTRNQGRGQRKTERGKN